MHCTSCDVKPYVEYWILWCENERKQVHTEDSDSEVASSSFHKLSTAVVVKFTKLMVIDL